MVASHVGLTGELYDQLGWSRLESLELQTEDSAAETYGLRIGVLAFVF
jgi:hypothetical protein